MPKFRKKPVVIEAEQFFEGSQPWPEGVERRAAEDMSDSDLAHGYFPWIETLEGGHIVSEGDWIITGVQGERYPCKPDIFDATYEPVVD